MEQYEPIPGESRLALVTTAVLLGVAVVVSILGLFQPSVLGGGLLMLAIGTFGFLYALRQRRSYLRAVSTGAVIERTPWTGPDAN